jgi:hypothetical protein
MRGFIIPVPSARLQLQRDRGKAGKGPLENPGFPVKPGRTEYCDLFVPHVIPM